MLQNVTPIIHINSSFSTCFWILYIICLLSIKFLKALVPLQLGVIKQKRSDLDLASLSF